VVAFDALRVAPSYSCPKREASAYAPLGIQQWPFADSVNYAKNGAKKIRITVKGTDD
jgi:hypothetical protein